MKFSLKSLFGKQDQSPQQESLEQDAPVENDHVENVDFYYTNIIDALILFTYDAAKLREMKPTFIDPLAELYEELEYAMTPVCLDEVFRENLIHKHYRKLLAEFHKEVKSIPNEIWNYQDIDYHPIWKATRHSANSLLSELGIESRTYDDSHVKVLDRDQKTTLMDQETARYIRVYFSKLMTDNERMALTHSMYSEKLENLPDQRKIMLERGLISESQEALDLLSDGYDSFERKAAARILAATPDQVFLNHCPKCERLARTPEAKQCRHCGHSWRN